MICLQKQLTPPRNARFRHVVFPAADEARRAVDFAPHSSSRIAAAAAPASAYQAFAPASLPPAVDSFIRFLFNREGLDARIYRDETICRRLPACLRALRANSIEQARQVIGQNPSLVAAAVGAMVIGVTSFFRDAAVTDHLSYTVLPALVKSPGPIRVWSAGCSDGDELYSIAILLSEMQALDRAQLLGTDCRAPAIARARAGSYDASALREVPQVWLDQYFSPPQNGCRRVCDTVRDAARWRTADVTRRAEPGPWDLVLCRNLAMYLRPPVAARLWRSLEQSLRPGGFLVLGKAERPLGANRVRAIAPCIYEKV